MTILLKVHLAQNLTVYNDAEKQKRIFYTADGNVI